MSDHLTHRELVAALASYKAALRSVISLLPQQDSARLKACLDRCATAAAATQKRLRTVSDQRLPLDTSRRLAEIDLAALVQQLLQTVVADESSVRPFAAAAASDAAVDGSAGDAPAAATWQDVQACIRECFECLNLLAAVATRACSRSSDPMLVLEQLMAQDLADSCVQYMHFIQGHATAHPGSDSSTADLAAAAVLAPCTYYGPSAAGLDSQPALQQLQAQLAAALTNSGFLPAAAELLLMASGSRDALQCQQAAHHLLTLALLLSGDSLVTAWQPDSPTSTAAATGGSPRAAAGAGSAAAPTGNSSKQLPCYAAIADQLCAPPVLQFLEERLYHSALELHCSAATAELSASIQLLPGRAVLDGSMELLASVLRALRCWRAILRSSSAQRARFAATPKISQLLLSALAAALADPVRAGSTDRQSLRSRVCKVCIDCLQMLAGRLPPDALLAILRPLLQDCSEVLVAVVQYVDVHKHAAKGSDLPFSVRIKTMDRTTADVVQRYCATAEQAVDIVQAVLRAVGSEGETPLTSACVGVLMASGMLPALEGVFRVVPPACQAHVAAAELLTHLLPHWTPSLAAAADSSGGTQALLALLTTLRKFIVSCGSLPEPDRELGVHVALAAEALLTRLVTNRRMQSASGAGSDGDSAVDSAAGEGDNKLLLRHAVLQLLPAIQSMCGALLKVPAAGTVTCLQSGSSQHLFLYLFKLLRQLSALHTDCPNLQLLQLLSSANSLQLAAAMLGTGFYAAPQGYSLLGELPSACSTATQEYLAKQCLQLLEHCSKFLTTSSLAAPAAAAAASAPAPSNTAAAPVPGPTKPISAPGVLVVEVLAEAVSADGLARSASPPAAAVSLQDAAAADPHTDAWRAQLLAGLLQSRLLPELQRLLLQLSAGAQEELVSGLTLSEAGSLGGVRRADSAASGLSPTASGSLLERGGSGRLSKGGGAISKSESWGGLQTAFSLSLSGARSDGGPGPYSQPNTPMASALMPLSGLSIPAINTRPLQREGSGNMGAVMLRGSSPTAFTAGLSRAAGAARSHGATPVAGTPVVGLGSSFSSLSSMGSGMLSVGVPLTSPVGSASNVYFESLVRTSAGGGAAAGADVHAPMLPDAAVALLQSRLDAVLVAVGDMVLQLADASAPPPAASTSGASSAAAGAAAAGAAPTAGSTAAPPTASPRAVDTECLQRAMAAMHMPPPAVSRLSDALRGQQPPSGSPSPRTSLPGADHSPVGGSGGGAPRCPSTDRFATLRSAMAAALDALAVQRAAAAAAASAAAASAVPGGGRVTAEVEQVVGSTEGDPAGLVFVLDGADGGASSAAGSAPGAAAGSLLGAADAAAGGQEGIAVSPTATQLAAAAEAPPIPVLPHALLRRLLSALAAATPPAVQLMDKVSSQVCGDLLWRQLQPLPVGCWHVGCTHLAGTSEAKASLRPCSSCSVAVYCSKACEKTAWAAHKGACAAFRAQVEAGVLQPAVVTGGTVALGRRGSGGLEGRVPLTAARMSRMSSGI